MDTFSLSVEIERNLISQRIKEVLASKKSEGMGLGRLKGSKNKEVKLTVKEEDIKKLLDKKVSVAAIARELEVNRLTVRRFSKLEKLGRKIKSFELKLSETLKRDFI